MRPLQPLSQWMIDTLGRMECDPNGEIILQSSMFWAPRDTPTWPTSGVIPVPKWWVGQRTILALLRRGLIQRVVGRMGDQRPACKLTEHGRAVLVVLRHEGRFLDPDPTMPSTAQSTGPGSASVAGNSAHTSSALPDGAGPRSSSRGDS